MQTPNVAKLTDGFYTVDRFEDDDYVVLELPHGQDIIELPQKLLPEDTKEGDVLKLTVRVDTSAREIIMRFEADEEETKDRLKKIEEIKKRIKKSNVDTGGDIDL